MSETILYSADAGIATITLNRPDRLNAFSHQMHAEIYDAMDRAGHDANVRCIVLRGRGKGFSAGADLTDIADAAEGNPDYGAYLDRTYNRLIQCMTAIQKPIVASLHGPVYGAGLSLALVCDMRIAAQSSTYSMAFIKIGLIPDAGALFFLPRIVGLGRAMELAMLGETLPADEAFRIGLVNRVVTEDELESQTASLAARLAESPIVALGLIKTRMIASFEHDLSTMLGAEAEGQGIAGRTDDHREGVQAFFEKRVAHFNGR